MIVIINDILRFRIKLWPHFPKLCNEFIRCKVVNPHFTDTATDPNQIEYICNPTLINDKRLSSKTRLTNHVLLQ